MTSEQTQDTSRRSAAEVVAREISNCVGWGCNDLESATNPDTGLPLFDKDELEEIHRNAGRILAALAEAGYTIAGPGQVAMHIDEDEWTRQTADDAAAIAQQRAEILALVRIVVMLRDIVSRERSAIEPIIARYRAESETTR